MQMILMKQLLLHGHMFDCEGRPTFFETVCSKYFLQFFSAESSCHLNVIIASPEILLYSSLKVKQSFYSICDSSVVTMGASECASCCKFSLAERKNFKKLPKQMAEGGNSQSFSCT